MRITLGIVIFSLLVCEATIGARRSTSQILGSSSVQSVVDSDTAGLAEAFPSIASANGSINSMQLYVNSTNKSTSIVVGIYSDTNGPSALLTKGTINTPVTGWNKVSIPAITLVSGRKYWIAILGKGGTIAYRDANCASSVTSKSSILTTLPSTWTTGQTWNTCNLSAYATVVTHTVNLSWQDTQPGSFNVYRGVNTGGPYTKINSTPVPVMTYADSTVASSTVYYYRVAQVINNVESGLSNEVQASVP